MSDVDALVRGLRQSGVIVGVYDKDEKLVFANPSYRDTFLPGHDGTPIHFPDVLRYGFLNKCGVQIDSGDVEAFLKDILPRRRAVMHRSIHTDTVDGRWLHISESLLPDGTLFSVGTDITQLKKDEKSLRREHEKTVMVSHELRRRTDELARSNADLEQFAFAASHDLQEPLRTVASYTQLLAGKGRADPGAAAQYAEFIVAGVRRMEALIADLLEFSRTSTLPMMPAPVDMADALKRALLNLDGTVRARQAMVTHDELPTVVAQLPQVTQLLQNLIGNAIKFCAEAPQIHVSAERRGMQWAIAVRDNGIGIEKEHFDRVFTIFQRLNARETYEGTGVGLAICRKIVERLGGRVWVESGGTGLGSTFWFTLPAAR